MPSTASQLLLHLPHVDQILGQSHGLAVPTDCDGSVKVGGGVSVLAVGDPDHGSAYLPDQTIVSIIIVLLRQAL